MSDLTKVAAIICPELPSVQVHRVRYNIKLGMCYQPITFLLFTTTRNIMGDIIYKIKWPKYFLLGSIILLILFIILAIPFFKTFYFASYPVTIGDVNGTISLAMSGYCLKLDVPNSNATSETCSRRPPYYNLGQFKFLLSIDLIFNAAIERWHPCHPSPNGPSCHSCFPTILYRGITLSNHCWHSRPPEGDVFGEAVPQDILHQGSGYGCSFVHNHPDFSLHHICHEAERGKCSSGRTSFALSCCVSTFSIHLTI